MVGTANDEQIGIDVDIPWKQTWPDISEDVAIDVMPTSNGEYVPKDPTAAQIRIMALQDEQIEIHRRRFNMDRRAFVRTAAAYSIGIWAINAVSSGRWGSYAFAAETVPSASGCTDLENPGAQLANLPGEFILDCQGHHLDSQGRWRIENPGFEQFLRLWASQSMGQLPGFEDNGEIRGFGFGGELDPMENLGRYHYFKEMFLDSSTTVSLLTALPNLPDETNILPVAYAIETAELANSLSKSQRCFIHAFAQPNRGFLAPDITPMHQAEDFAWMEDTARNVDIHGWKLYCGWGDAAAGTPPPLGSAPPMNGWWFDDDNGMAIVEHIRRISDKYNRPKVICTHKGLAFNGTFDSAKFSPRDMGVVGRQFTDVKFYVYHCGYDGEYMAPYPGDEKVNSSDRSVNAYIKSLRENAWDATRFIPPGLEHGNTVNMYGELGSVWWNVMNDADQAVHLLGKLITYVGPRRVVYGTDCIWYGNPQPQIVTLRALQFSDEAKELYNLPFGLDGDRFDPRRNALSGASYRGHPDVKAWPKDGKAHPERSIRNGILGRNAAEAYGLDPDAHRGKISCDQVEAMRSAYLINPGTAREQTPYRTNAMVGPRTRREFFRFVTSPDYQP
ncbi:MAG: hypothetical protein ACT4PP_05495 [Sporichthyaceae bacterium]